MRCALINSILMLSLLIIITKIERTRCCICLRLTKSFNFNTLLSVVTNILFSIVTCLECLNNVSDMSDCVSQEKSVLCHVVTEDGRRWPVPSVIRSDMTDRQTERERETDRQTELRAFFISFYSTVWKILAADF